MSSSIADLKSVHCGINTFDIISTIIPPLISILIKAMNICEVHLHTKHMYEWHIPLFNDNRLPQAPSKDHSWLNIPASQPASQYRSLSFKFRTISGLLHSRRHHLILTSSVQLTKCRLENKWQTPGQINYVSCKMLASERHTELPLEARVCVCAIWLVWERTSFGVQQWTPWMSSRSSHLDFALSIGLHAEMLCL